MKIIGILLIIIGIIGIILTVLLPGLLGYSGLIAGATAILTGVVFVAACYNRCNSYCERRNNNNCCN